MLIRKSNHSKPLPYSTYWDDVSVPILEFGEFSGEVLSMDKLNWMKIIPEERIFLYDHLRRREPSL